ncbi:MAG: adenosylcobinamide-GDP ribazoletransferase, partial [Dactylosporangium sp.]|nr:adenosylcobinamide-GDP ribazoletransferase [Dactylosporangium sp.]NNJ61207.1 adenosylcobinamide-GDP ribazoletransferase [Dactylosporangium sp.]
GIPAARETGMGALVAGTVAAPTVALAALGIALAAISAIPGRPWQGPVAVVAALVAAGLLIRHAVRRLGGITGDVLGAAVEVTGTLTLVGLALGPA